MVNGEIQYRTDNWNSDVTCHLHNINSDAGRYNVCISIIFCIYFISDSAACAIAITDNDEDIITGGQSLLLQAWVSETQLI